MCQKPIIELSKAHLNLLSPNAFRQEINFPNSYHRSECRLIFASRKAVPVCPPSNIRRKMFYADLTSDCKIITIVAAYRFRCFRKIRRNIHHRHDSKPVQFSDDSSRTYFRHAAAHEILSAPKSPVQFPQHPSASCDLQFRSVANRNISWTAKLHCDCSNAAFHASGMQSVRPAPRSDKLKSPAAATAFWN